MAPFYGRSSTASRPEPLGGGSLLFITKFPEIHKGWIGFSEEKNSVEISRHFWELFCEIGLFYYAA